MVNKNLLKIAQRLGREELKEEVLEPPKPIQTSSLEDLTDSWKIPNIQYRNGIHTVNLSKELLDNGNTKTQDQWAEYSQDGFRVADFPLYQALFTELYNQRENPTAQEAKEFIKESMFERYLAALTRIKYKPTGKDIVIHNYNTQDQYELEENIVGPDEWITNTTNRKPYKAILGTDDVDEVNEVYKWITGKDAYMWRVNSNPEEDDERVAGFYAGSDRADLNCYWDPRISYYSLGARVAKNRY